MILSINQPAYLPWLGYFDRIAKSDLHIVLDDVQIERNTKTSFTNRNKVRTGQGWTWLTVPLKKGPSADNELICNVRINDNGWQKKHLKTLQQSYAKSLALIEHEVWLTDIYHHDWELLAALLKNTTQYILDYLEINTPVLYSSEMNVAGHKSERILNFCKEVGADHYLSGPFGKDYLEDQQFEKNGISISYHDYQHPVYKQIHGEFMPYMCIFDLLFNHGKDSIRYLENNY